MTAERKQEEEEKKKQQKNKKQKQALDVARYLVIQQIMQVANTAIYETSKGKSTRIKIVCPVPGMNHERR